MYYAHVHQKVSRHDIRDHCKIKVRIWWDTIIAVDFDIIGFLHVLTFFVTNEEIGGAHLPRPILTRLVHFLRTIRNDLSKTWDIISNEIHNIIVKLIYRKILIVVEKWYLSGYTIIVTFINDFYLYLIYDL